MSEPQKFWTSFKRGDNELSTQNCEVSMTKRKDWLELVTAEDAAKLLEAVRLANEAFDDLFGQCLSNPVYNTWGKQVNMSKLNDARQACGRFSK